MEADEREIIESSKTLCLRLVLNYETGKSKDLDTYYECVWMLNMIAIFEQSSMVEENKRLALDVYKD